MRKINILNIQMQSKISDKQSNLDKIKKFIENNNDKKLDLVVMPEFFNTGISHNAFIKLAETEGSNFETITFLSELAKEYNTNILCGSIIEREQDKLYNTSYFLNRRGEIIGKYRKIHLFNYFGGTEGKLISPGDQHIVINTDIGKIGLAICFDIRYPIHFYNLMKMGAEIIVLPTAWLAFKDDNIDYIKDNWVSFNKVRASENLLYVISSNQYGKIDSRLSGIGHSLVVNPKGEVVSIIEEEQTAKLVTIDLDDVDKIRKECPINRLN